MADQLAADNSSMDLTLNNSASNQTNASIASEISTYTPVLSSVKIISDRVSSNGFVQSSLQKLQSIVPESVTAQAVAAAGQAHSLSDKYAAPLVTRVDTNLSNYIVRLLALPSTSLAYGSAKVHQVDDFAYSLTPAFAKPTYVATRQRVADTIELAKEVSGRTVDTVKRVKTERSEALWNALEQVSQQIASLKAAVASSSTQARQALDLHHRLSELQAKVAEATASKRAQARHRSQEILHSVQELGVGLSGFLESNLTTQQRDTLHAYWSRLLEGVNALKDSLHLGGTPASIPSSRSDSGVSAVEESVESSVAADSSDSIVPAVNANGEQVLVEAVPVEVVQAENESKSTNASDKQSNKRTNKSSAHAGKAAKQPTTSSQLQQQEEEKQKVEAENE